MWKAKNSSIGSSSTIAAESQINRPGGDAHSPDNTNPSPGKSFRSFRFDTVSLLQVMETTFSI